MSNQQPGGTDWRVTRQMAPPITAETVNCNVVSPTAQDCGASEFSVFFVPKEHKALLANHATMHRPSLKRHEASDGLRDWSSALAAATATEPSAADIPRSSAMLPPGTSDTRHWYGTTNRASFGLIYGYS
jgi:hypothetical protein